MVDKYTTKIETHLSLMDEMINDVNRDNDKVGLQRAIENRIFDKFGNLVGNTSENGTDLQCVMDESITISIKKGCGYINGVRCVLENDISFTLSQEDGYYMIYCEAPSNDIPPYNLTSENFGYVYDEASVPTTTEIDRLILSRAVIQNGIITSIHDMRQMFNNTASGMIVQVRKIIGIETSVANIFGDEPLSDYLIPPGFIGIFDTLCPSGWTRLSGSGEPFYNRFIVGSSSYGSTGGSDFIDNHTHVGTYTFTGTTSQHGGIIGSSPGIPSVFQWIIHWHNIDHTHNVTTIENGGHDNRPSYINVVFCKKD
ncbi:MAG: hypothetical protein ACTSRA_00430 [Promethearchaeota archaeon]|nr:MAG: hypothetical protein [Helarchaeota virus Nidhogg Meg22_1012]URC17422.1 MAG: hypothetical protein [Helarchaeota virus Nidhogg Meg22_1214]